MRPQAVCMVRFCLSKAAECCRLAERATKTVQRRAWLEIEGQWFYLARSYDNERRRGDGQFSEERRIAANIAVALLQRI
jgi:hypothetical protein